MASPQTFDCIFCKDSFASKEDLQIHFSLKGNKNETGSQGDRGVTGDVVSCDVCSEVFPTISKAITHKHKMHPDHDAKYFCPWCGKLFTMKHLYNKHVQSTHDSRMEGGLTGFHCDYCEVDFFVPSAMLYHNKFFHRQDTELAAIGHSKKMKMYNEEMMQIYYCPFCGEEYCNKVNLHVCFDCSLFICIVGQKHMGDDHIDENQSPEDVLRCPLCEALFYHLDAYELHLTFHSTADLYSEENELASQITEFSLETVSPTMEKVENETQEEKSTDASQIEDFLQQALNETNDQDNSNDSSAREKKKKHKKHKKSKKEKAITLDEFLTMNKDVFGEGLDFQGIEEVPTQIVAKRLNRKTQGIKGKPGPKPLPSELAKLKKQGLIIKKNPSKNLGPVPGSRIGVNKQVNNPVNIVNDTSKLKPIEQNRYNVTSTPNEVLTKLLNQSNSQIKILKKSSLDNSQNETTNEISSTENIPENRKDENTEDSCVKSQNDDMHRNENSLPPVTASKSVNNSEGIDSLVPEQDAKDLIALKKSQIQQNGKNVNDTEEEIKDEHSDVTEKKSVIGINKIDTTENVSVVHNLGQHITIKPIPSPKKVLNNETDTCDKIKEAIKSGTEVDHKEFVEDSDNLNGTENKSIKKTFNVLKHLSHLLTVKSVNKTGSTTPVNMPTSDQIIDKSECNQNMINKDSDVLEDKTRNFDVTKEDTFDFQNSFSNFKPLKNLGRHITIKPLIQSNNFTAKDGEKPDANIVEDSFNNADDYDCNQELHIFSAENKKLPSHLAITKNIAIKNIENESISPNQTPKVFKNTTSNEDQVSSFAKESTIIRKQSCSDIVKRLSNITAKPINTGNNCKSGLQQTQHTNSTKDMKQDIEDKEIEVFNIDDSDDEADKSQESIEAHTPIQKGIPPKQTVCNKINQSKEMLQALGKHITIKPTNQSKPINKENSRHICASSDEEIGINKHEGEFDEATEQQKQSNNKNNSILHNRLKNLSGVTVKSNLANTADHIPSNLKAETAFEGEDNSDSNMSRNIKITELPEDFTSDDDIPLVKSKIAVQTAKNVTVEEPDDSNSDHEANIENDVDLESLIMPNTVTKSNQNTKIRPACLNNLKNLTIKSSKENVDQINECPSKEKSSIPNQNRELCSKPYRQARTFSQDDIHESVQNAYKLQNSAQVSASSNQINTVNQQISVQTFKTQTVIEEVTTTVTKTIRTVNKTVQQEMRNMNSAVPLRPQKIQGIRPNHHMRNMSGKPIRPSAPIMGTRIRNPNPVVRPVVGSSIRPSNQLVPVRLGVNLARPSNPNMAVAKRVPVAPTSHYKPIVGKPLKIAPSALLQSSKRPATEEANRPFSCFKKAKESLIPGVDLPGEQDVTAEHFASTSQMSKSNFVSKSKSVKGNSVITSTQTKSEYSASSEQLNKLNSLTGLKVLKTGQTKQVSKIEETTEVNTSKRSALAAIEKLQKQGLLVKKPRKVEPDFSEHSNSEADDYYDT